MASLLKFGSSGDEVERLQGLLGSNGYCADLTGRFDDITREQVMVFQAQHIDQRGLPLVVDGVVGDRTWWALENASGNVQRNHLQRQDEIGLTVQRRLLLQTVYHEHQKPVVEVPDGSNRSPDIDRYWGNTGVKGLAWCCAFVSWSLNEALGKLPIGGKHHLGVQVMWHAALKDRQAVSLPKPGDVFVQLFARGRGHTGFVVGVSEDYQTVYTCEGNCGNRVKLGRRKSTTIDGYIDAIQDDQGLDFKRGDSFDFESVATDGTR